MAVACLIKNALVEWPANDADPFKYQLSTLPEDISRSELVAEVHMRWRTERDYQDLKQELGLGHYEGRGWRGFRHHATLSIAAYGFLVSERSATRKSGGSKEASPHAKSLTFPRITTLLAEGQRAQRHASNSIASIRYQPGFHLILQLGQCPCCEQQNLRQLY